MQGDGLHVEVAETARWGNRLNGVIQADWEFILVDDQ